MRPTTEQNDGEVIALCAADFDIRYALFSKQENVYVGYYDPEHRLTIAKRDKGGNWDFEKLPETVNWDSHKFINIAVDANDIIHVTANMHCQPLVYYKSQLPGDIHSLKRMNMTGVKEDSVTYPEFLLTDDRLLFHYRDGRSGNGNTYFNRYDPEQGKWLKHSDRPLFDGIGLSNSYFKGPVIGPDGKFHIIWCWRDTPDCITNHGLYYASSSDLISWHSTTGFSKHIPITPEDNEFLVDDIKKHSGLINGGFSLGFTNEGVPMIAYHKYDDKGHTNIFLASLDKDNNWTIEQLTGWKWRWDFSGKGSIPFHLDMHDIAGSKQGIKINFSRLKRRGLLRAPVMIKYTVNINTYGKVEEGLCINNAHIPYKSRRKGMILHSEPDRGDKMHRASNTFTLFYETVPPHRDKKLKKLINPRPSVLRLIKI